jgi:hypothetical protein
MDKIMIEKPAFISDKKLLLCLEFLDELRKDGVVNMLGTTPYLLEFNLSTKEARRVLGYWMETFGERHNLGNE